MQDDATEQLHVIMHHVPGDFITSSHPMISIDSFVALDADEVVRRRQVSVEVVGRNHHLAALREATGCILHNGKHLRKNLFQNYFHLVRDGLLNLIDLCPDGFTFFQLFVFDACAELVHFGAFIGHIVLDTLLDLIYFGTQFIVCKCLDRRINGLDFFYVGRDFL